MPLTEFQIACMTLPYAAFPAVRALKGIAGAGYKYVAFGVNHPDSAGRPTPMIPVEAPPGDAKRWGDRARDLGLTPVMMFSSVNVEAPESVKAHLRRIEQAAAAGVPFILAFGHTRGGAEAYPAWIRNLKEIGPAARQAGVTIVIKQHGGNTGTGAMCARILREVADEGVKMFFDSGNTLWYNNTDPIADMQACAEFVRGFAIKDFRGTPKKQGCGPGFGEVDHYKLLMPVIRTGLKMPLACETIFEPLVPRPESPEALDALARRAREYLEYVTRGLLAYAAEAKE